MRCLCCTHATVHALKFQIKRYFCPSTKVKSSPAPIKQKQLPSSPSLLSHSTSHPPQSASQWLQCCSCCCCRINIPLHKLRPLFPLFVRFQWFILRVLYAIVVLTLFRLLNDTGPPNKRIQSTQWPAAPKEYKRILSSFTFAIKSGGRPDKVQRLVKSIKYYFPSGHHILIVDDGDVPLSLSSSSRNGVDIVQLPRDSGLAAGRNELLRHTKTPYFLYFDDDFWLEDDSHVHKLMQYLDEHKHVDIVGGTVSDRPDYVGFNFDIIQTTNVNGDKEKRLIQKPVKMATKGCTKVDIVPNFFAARVSALRTVKWDPHFKLGEHEDFFVRAKKIGLHVETCSKISMIHHAPNTDWYYSATKNMQGYAKRRRRAFAYMQDFLKKHQLASYFTQTGVLLASNEYAQILTTQKMSKRIIQRHASSTTDSRPKVSAIVVDWKRHRNVLKIVRSLSTIPFIDDIVIYNNNIMNPEAKDQFSDTPHLYSIVNVIPASTHGNLNTESRFRACDKHAKNDVCMFVDDDFWPSTFENLYESWLEDRDNIHALANIPVYWNNLRWSFIGKSKNSNNEDNHDEDGTSITTGFTWVGVGAIVSKKLVSHFLYNQLPLITPARKGIADNYFSLMSNRIPRVLMVELDTKGLEQHSGYSSTQDVIDELDVARKEAIELVHSGIVPFLPRVLTPLAEETNKWLRCAGIASDTFDTRVNGWYSLKRTFITNMKLTETRPSLLAQYNSPDVWMYAHTPIDFEASGQHTIEQLKEFQTFTEYAPGFAVDNWDWTNWESTRNVRCKDWFGLDLGSIVQGIGQLVVRSTKEVREMRLEVSSDGLEWIHFTLMHKLQDERCDILGWTDGAEEGSGCREMKYDLRRVSIHSPDHFVSLWFNFVNTKL